MSHKRITDSGIYSNYPIESLVPASHNITKFKKKTCRNSVICIRLRGCPFFFFQIMIMSVPEGEA